MHSIITLFLRECEVGVYLGVRRKDHHAEQQHWSTEQQLKCTDIKKNMHPLSLPVKSKIIIIKWMSE